MGDMEKKRWRPNAGVSFSERNLNRWSIYGSRNAKIERILTRENAGGSVVETCQIGAVGYKGRMRSLSSVHGRMMNIIEALFFRQGMPADDTIRISSIALYNYLADISTMFNPDKIKGRDGNKFRDWIYDTLHVLTQVTLMFSSWEKKDGTRGVYGMKLLKKFKMWGKDKDAEWGMITITIDPEYASGLRARNTTPLLIEKENAVPGDNAFALYRYLRQVLFKTPIFKINVLKLHRTLSIGRARKDLLVADLRDAAAVLEGREIPNGRIAKCEVFQEGRDWFFRATLGPAADRRPVRIDIAAETRRAELQRAKDMEVKDENYLAAFRALPDEERSKCQKQIDAILRDRVKNGLGLETHRRIATVEVMHDFLMKKSDVSFGNLVEPRRDRMAAHDAAAPVYACDAQRAGIRRLVNAIRGVAEIRK